MSTAAAEPDDLVSVARVVDAYGIRGWIKLETFSGDSPVLQTARHWWLQGRDGTRRCVEVVEVKPHSAHYVAQLAGIDDREAALALKGMRVEVSRAEFPAEDGDEYYWIDLIGCAVHSVQGEQVGQVVDMMDNGAHAILAVQPASAGRAVELIPFVDAHVPEVDLQARRIVVDWQFEPDAGR